MKILLVEDELKIADFISAGLGAKSVNVSHCIDGDQGYEFACKHTYDAIILDIMFRGRDRLDLLRSLRRAGVNTPVILLTARNELGDRVQG